MVSETGIAARNPEKKLENPASIDKPRSRIRLRQTEPFCYPTGFAARTKNDFACKYWDKGRR
jgi:hypothetical protein